MKKRILLLATVAALMAVMLVAMASASLAVPPASGQTGCEGGLINGNHGGAKPVPLAHPPTATNTVLGPGLSAAPALVSCPYSPECVE
jgi:hypothetical protein